LGEIKVVILGFDGCINSNWRIYTELKDRLEELQEDEEYKVVLATVRPYHTTSYLIGVKNYIQDVQFPFNAIITRNRYVHFYNPDEPFSAYMNYLDAGATNKSLAISTMLKYWEYTHENGLVIASGRDGLRADLQAVEYCKYAGAPADAITEIITGVSSKTFGYIAVESGALGTMEIINHFIT